MSDSDDYLIFLGVQSFVVLFVSLFLALCMETISDNIRNSQKCLVVFGITYIVSVVLLYCCEIIILINLCRKSKDRFPYGPLFGVLVILLIAYGGLSILGEIVLSISDEISDCKDNTDNRTNLMAGAKVRHRTREETVIMDKPQVNLPQMMPLNGNKPSTKIMQNINSTFIVDPHMHHLNCGICYMPLVEGTDAIQTACGHIFDASCFYGWIAQNLNCPDCGVTWTGELSVNLGYPIF